MSLAPFAFQILFVEQTSVDGKFIVTCILHIFEPKETRSLLSLAAGRHNARPFRKNLLKRDFEVGEDTKITFFSVGKYL